MKVSTRNASDVGVCHHQSRKKSIIFIRKAKLALNLKKNCLQSNLEKGNKITVAILGLKKRFSFRKKSSKLVNLSKNVNFAIRFHINRGVSSASDDFNFLITQQESWLSSVLFISKSLQLKSEFNKKKGI